MADSTRTNVNAVTLVRVSTKKQGDIDRFGMDAQRASNQRIVTENRFIVRKTIEYKDVSGDAVMFTEEMHDLQTYLRTPEMKNGHLVAKELSRILRPTFSDYPLLQVFVDQRISIHLPHYVLQLWTPEGRMLAGVLCAVDFNESQRIRERCMGGREVSRRLGFCAAGSRTIPTGVTWDVKTKQWGYDAVYAPKIREAFHLVAGGETNFQYIIRKLSLRLRPTQGTPKLTTPTGLRRLLENRLFIGERVIDKKFDLSISKEKLFYTGKDGKPHMRKRPLIQREPDEVTRHQVIAEPLVSVEVFEKVQAILRAKSDRHHQMHAVHALRPKFAYRGLLFCGDCGQPLYTANSKSQSYYRCRDRFLNRGEKKGCKLLSMRREKLEAELDRLFSREFPRNRFLAALMVKHAGSESRNESERRKKDLHAQQKKLAAKRERIIEFALDGSIATQDRDNRLRIVDAELASIRKQLEELTDVSMPTYAEWQRIFRPFMRGFPGMAHDEKRRLVTSRFEKIMVKDYKVVSCYLLTGETITHEPVTHIETDATKCYSCQQRSKVQGEEYCAKCSHELEMGDMARQLDTEAPFAHPGVWGPASSALAGHVDTSQRL